jgi:hypothetical protein
MGFGGEFDPLSLNKTSRSIVMKHLRVRLDAKGLFLLDSTEFECDKTDGRVSGMPFEWFSLHQHEKRDGGHQFQKHQAFHLLIP